MFKKVLIIIGLIIFMIMFYIGFGFGTFIWENFEPKHIIESGVKQ